MRYANLTEQQKEWIAELQRAVEKNRDIFRYVPKVVCDTETGDIYRSCEGFYGGIEILKKIGKIPRKAIPHRNLGLMGRRTFRVMERRIYQTEGSPW